MPSDRLVGGGWPAIRYCLDQAKRAGGWRAMWQALRTRNTCKTCAVGMGGQRGGMTNESGHFPEVCKKSVQAMAADMQPPIPDELWSQRSVETLRKSSPRELESLGRLATPLFRSRADRYFQPISWHDAFTRIADRLKRTDPQRTFWYFSGRSSNEAAFLLQLVARVYGSNHVNNCSYYCHQASGVGLTSVTGSGTATVVWDDLYLADLVFLIGGNPASNHPRLITALADVRKRGGKVIVVNPVREAGLERFKIPSRPLSLLFGSSIASRFVQVDGGGDLAFLWGLSKYLEENGELDEAFLREHCEGVEGWREQLHRLAWGDIESASGVSRHDIEAVGKEYAASEHTIFAWAMGITHHEHGVANVQAIANAALARGMVGKRGAGLMPIRGHSNVQGVGSVGAVPRLKPEILASLEDRLGMRLPTAPGLDTLGCIEAATDGAMDVACCLGGNLYGSNPDAKFARESLGRLKQIIYLNTTLNTGHVQVDAEETVILPVLARDEEPHRTTQESMFNFVRLSDGGPARHRGPHSELYVIARIAASICDASSPGLWQRLADPDEIRSWIADVIPGYRKIGSISATGEEFQIEGRTFHRPLFATASGRARLHVHSISPSTLDRGQWRLMTVRSEGQFNTVVYEESDTYRGQVRRDVVLLHPDDLLASGWQPGCRVTVSTDCGRLEVTAEPFARIKPGNALMYFPEANVLVPRTIDRQSRTPVFKGLIVRIQPTGTGSGDSASDSST